MIKNLFRSQLRRNMMSGVLATSANILVMIVSYKVCLSFLGYESYGVWLILATVLTFLEIGGNLGIQPAVSKLVAEEYGRNNLKAIQSYIFTALILLLGTGLLGFLIIFVFRSPIIQLFNLQGPNAITAYALLPYIGILCIYVFVIRILGAAISGLGRMDILNYSQLAGRLVLFACTICLLYYGQGVKSLLIANIVSYACIHLIIIVAIKRLCEVKLMHPNNWSFYRLKKLLSFGMGIVGGSILNMFISPFNKVIVSKFIGVGSVPIYEIAYSGTMRIRGIIEVGFRAIMPEISQINSKNTPKSDNRIRSINKKASLLTLLGATPLFIAGIALIHFTPIIQIWLREDYIPEITTSLCWMFVAVLISTWAIPAYHILIGLGKVKKVVISHFTIAASNVLLIVAALIIYKKISVSMIIILLIFSHSVSTAYLIYQSKACIKARE